MEIVKRKLITNDIVSIDKRFRNLYRSHYETVDVLLPEYMNDNPYYAASLLNDDLEYLLIHGEEDTDIEERYENMKKTINNFSKEFLNENVPFSGVKESAEIRKDWKNALDKYDNYQIIAGKIGYGFSIDDISELAKLHSENYKRNKIEDLLTDCNFHTECADFSNKNYSKYIIPGN